jgi:hypothetical protein
MAMTRPNKKKKKEINYLFAIRVQTHVEAKIGRKIISNPRTFQLTGQLFDP